MREPLTEDVMARELVGTYGVTDVRDLMVPTGGREEKLLSAIGTVAGYLHASADEVDKGLSPAARRRITACAHTAHEMLGRLYGALEAS